uniref:Uncharacterized protein n=1 Tax=Haplochromis burtoni TaxID=8153 RepID=A0A3Q2W648_HAPBU
MKRRQLLLSLPHLPTITETLEDLPVNPSSSQSTQSSQSLEDYMTSIQALARPLSVSASAPRGSPRTLRTSRPSSLNLNSSTEDFSLRMSRERDCKGKDPVDWLLFLVFCQIKPYLLKKVDDPSLLTITTIVICIHSVRGCVRRQAAHILVKPCYRKNFTLYFIYTIKQR